MFSQRARNCLFDIRIPNKTCVFFSFCFFVLFSMVRVHAKAGPWGRPHAAYPIRAFEHILLTLQKKPLLSTSVLDICTRAGPKTLPKKVQKNSNGVVEGSHSRPPGRSKSMVFDTISSGGKAPSDAWLGLPRCSLCL